jgi:hypothetical protein
VIMILIRSAWTTRRTPLEFVAIWVSTEIMQLKERRVFESVTFYEGSLRSACCSTSLSSMESVGLGVVAP